MSDLLEKIPFTEQLLTAVQDFECGDEEWETPLAAWIKAQPDKEDGALGQMRKEKNRGRQLDVWLHVNGAGELVAYSSLGESNWPWPLLTDKKVPISIIPNVAIQTEYQGKPDDPPRYSKQLIDHLVFEARKYAHRKPALALYVDPRNIAAIRLYKRELFEDYQTWSDHDAGITYQGMALKLADHQPYIVARQTGEKSEAS